MAIVTNIEWCDCTWSPWLGCSKVSPGCRHCYIVRAPALRFRGLDHGEPRQRTSKSYWRQPLRWDGQAAATGKRLRIFPSLCDWLDLDVPLEWFADFMDVVYNTANLDWLLLTKRFQHFEHRLSQAEVWHRSFGSQLVAQWLENWQNGDAPHNVWLGVSVEDQHRADERILKLCDAPARVRFLSAEPLLEAIDLDLYRNYEINWIIVGGESGAGARKCNAEWIRSIVHQCALHGTACFVKQLGSNVDTGPGFGPFFAGTRATLKHGKGGDPSEWPSELRVREFPKLTQ